jgi:hypothetical protein
MTFVESGVQFTITFPFDSEYGTLTEGDYSLYVRTGNTERIYEPADVTFTIVQPVAGTSDGSLSANFTVADPSNCIFDLYKNDTGYNTKLGTIRLRVTDIATTVTSDSIIT